MLMAGYVATWRMVLLQTAFGAEPMCYVAGTDIVGSTHLADHRTSNNSHLHVRVQKEWTEKDLRIVRRKTQG